MFCEYTNYYCISGSMGKKSVTEPTEVFIQRNISPVLNTYTRSKFRGVNF